jgi:blocked-early-in-transport protein 1
MSDAYERERQNNSRLSELSAKVTALRGVTVDIYDNARAQDVIDNTVGWRSTLVGYRGIWRADSL